MKYDKRDRQAIKGLTVSGRQLFDVLESCELGNFTNVPGICFALQATPTLVAFSCLSGSAQGEELDLTPGMLFEPRFRKRVETFLALVRGTLPEVPFMVIIDDCEPCRVWQWEKTQEEITQWCELVIDDIDVPAGWQVVLWSDIEPTSGFSFQESLVEVSKPEHALLVNQHIEHMNHFPNKKLRGDIRIAATRRVAAYAIQGKILEHRFPNAILCQTETPWRVKDPLYSPLRHSQLPIIHPFPDERR